MRLSHIAFLVPDYDAGIRFLKTIGFDLTEDTDQGGGKRWVVMHLPGGNTGLLVARAVGDQRSAVGAQAGGRVGFFLQTEDFAQSAARVRDAGGQFEEEPRHEPYGIVAVFRDPFGNRWDLIEPASC